MPALIHAVVGGATQTGFMVAARTDTPGIPVRVRTGATWHGPVVTDARGYAHVPVDGLAPNTKQAYDVEVAGVIAAAMPGSGHTLPAPGDSFRFLIVSDHDWEGSNIYARLLSEYADAAFILHCGDFHNEWITANVNPAPANVDQLLAPFERFFANANCGALYRSIPLEHIWSDCDSGGANHDGTAPALAGGQAGQTWRTAFAHRALPDPKGIYRSFVVGRMRIVQTDERTYSSDKNAPDGPAKTKLGATQKAWFKNELALARAQNQIVLWQGDGPMYYNPTTGTDKWAGYPSERVEIGEYIRSLGVPLVRANGDDHTLIYDDGRNNAYGAYPTVGSAPASTTAFSTTLPASNGSWPPPAGNNISGRQYTVVEYSESGNTITLSFTGIARDAANGTWPTRLTMELSWEVNPIPIPTAMIRIWDGNVERAVTAMEVWDGALTVPVIAWEVTPDAD